MTLFLCKLWPYLAGGLIGWLLAGWLARRLKKAEPPIEKIIEKEVEKIVDNPKHLSLISKLENENNKIPSLMSKLSLFESSKPKIEIREVEKLVEVDSPKLLARIKDLEVENAQISDLKGKLILLETNLANPKEKIVEVDSPRLLARIKDLEAENTQITSLKDKIKSFEANPSKIEEKIVEVDNPKLLSRIRELESENDQIADLQEKINKLKGAEVKEKIVEVDNPELLAEIKILKSKLQSSNDTKSSSTPGMQSLMSSVGGGNSGKNSSTNDSECRKRIKALEAEITTLKRGPKIDLIAAKSAGITIKDENDLTAIEGIGPKISDLIKADGVTTFYALADTSPSTIQTALDKAGASYKMAKPGTWPDQANLAANNRWPALKALQDVLVGGVYPDGASSKESDDDKKSSVQAESTQLTGAHVDAAKAAGFKIKRSTSGYADFTIVEGIGPKINGLIHDAGIHTYEKLGNTLVEDIQKILDDAGSRYRLAKPGTWPAQSDMAADNKWEELKKWQDELDGGKE